ncbi:hypothetical protein VNI00_009021 [Paramarasmius palmivorus]|uniref:Chitinase n=1 Tax=Paramarasmius palmivorus TaxID=297713 RepID=A0AAW0CP23_9AGAR
MVNLTKASLLSTFYFLSRALLASAADCKTATVGSPDSTCFDIYTRAGITAAQFASYNPGLDCSVLQIGQKVCISPGSLPSNAPGPSPNGTCFEYFVQPNDSCFAIATKFSITVDQIEEWNKNTWKWTGCSGLQIGFTMCVSPGNPPPIPAQIHVYQTAYNLLSQAALQPGHSVADVDWKGFTDVKFAFATISQGMEIQVADGDVPLVKELVAQKARYPSMKVSIALGGWDFSQSEPTRDLFSVMIGTSGNRATFISSVKNMLSTYNLDGIEYPGAIERNAPATDTPNLTAFFKELRAGLPNSIISCATPAGYWFLQGFEIDKIAGSVDYLNMMSYDYHGQWDTNVAGQASVTNPHTSLLDIESSVLLYLRAGIDLAKVNLGLAWYGRTYQLADTSCVGYNCTMTGGGFPGPCSASAGYLTQYEIDSILNTSRIQPTLDGSSQTYWFNTQGALITFDREDTWA